MMSLASDDLTLADLPADIIRKIITLDSIDDVRMVRKMKCLFGHALSSRFPLTGMQLSMVFSKSENDFP